MSNLARILFRVATFAAAVAYAVGERKNGPKSDLKPGTRSLDDLIRETQTRRRKPPEAGLPVPRVPPSGPVPKQGGAAAALDAAGD